MDAHTIRRRGAGLAGALALALAGCGSDDVEKQADKLKTEAQSAAQSFEKEAKDLRKEIREGASRKKIENQIDELEREAKAKGEDFEKEAKELRRELREQVP